MNIPHSIFADIVRAVHFAWVLFNLFGFFLVRRFPRVKYFHVGTLTVTALLMLTGRVCPLTTLEQWLQWKSDPSSAYRESFLAHYVGRALYIEAPPWVITAITATLALTAIWLYFLRPWIRKVQR